MILDCSTSQTALESLAGIFQVSEKELRTFFDTLPPAQLYDHRVPPLLPPEDKLWVAFQKKFPQKPHWTGVHWFHLTRVFPGTTFEEGIQPLGDRLHVLWDQLEPLALQHITAANWQDFKRHLAPHHNHDLYNLKIKDRQHWGPYALLVREVAFSPRTLGNHDYLATPEIIEDICVCFHERFGMNLLPQYQQHTQPCIVTFVGPADREDVLPTSLFYAYQSYHNEELTWHANTCFDGEGHLIPATAIRNIMILDP
ncbi:hypothetical protein [Deinococcus cellulosilyticus]|uniref:Uncharacterized protein n=1 Tax=Deinococcus cellulosilyticus (strain DSM 18568 / NBRC 106333 / KACC 11606 / 5516J-15) TaxID=1223518 RepID=A0A511NB79_DEIC1|nr:hypothetical protein [Deinococcus cellulosilyticus]GEM49778.1 hypothetical protein DC3_54130 [Deinococcus cellulosilyticus NBRC 106333 = KACC 11606]